MVKKKSGTSTVKEDWVGDEEDKVDLPRVQVGIQTNKTELLGILNIVGCLVDDFGLTCSKHMVRIGTVDPSHVAMVALDIPAEYFEKYSFMSEDKEVDERRIGISCVKLAEFLKTVSLTDEIMIAYDSKITTFVIRAGRVKRSMAEIDIAHIAQSKVPNLSQPTKIKMRNDQFRQSLVAIDQISDFIKIVTEKKAVTIYGQGDIDKVELKYTKKDDVEIKGKSSTALYPLDYLMTICKAIGTKADLSIALGSDYPCTINFEVEGKNANIDVHYLLAPRVADD